MSVGFSKTKIDIDSNAASAIVQVRQALEYAVRVNNVLLGLSTADLVALGYDETSKGEVSLLKSAMADMADLHSTSHSGRTQGTARNFFVFADKLTAFN